MTVAYELIRSKRRTLAIVIDSEGKCSVRAPLQARLSDIEGFVQEKRLDTAEAAAVCCRAEKASVFSGRRNTVKCIG
ncbi:MAG: M48 family metallopeptidase [Acidaminococcaceae bacterium]|nr:M48 family metallopeptidase [Acidaminococcaceae bacterium]